MPNRLVIIPLIVAILAQAVLGGFRGGLAVCFGHGSATVLEAAPVATATAATDVVDCSGACCPGHGSEWPSPVPADHSGHDGCDCTDVDLSADPLGLCGLSTDMVRLAPPAVVPAPLLCGVTGQSVDREGRRALRAPEDEAQTGRLVVVRAVRRLV